MESERNHPEIIDGRFRGNNPRNRSLAYVIFAWLKEKCILGIEYLESKVEKEKVEVEKGKREVALLDLDIEQKQSQRAKEIAQMANNLCSTTELSDLSVARLQEQLLDTITKLKVIHDLEVTVIANEKKQSVVSLSDDQKSTTTIIDIDTKGDSKKS